MTASMIALILPGGLAGLATAVILIAAIVAIVFIVTRAMGVAIPSWAVQILWVIVIAVVGIWAIRFLTGL